MAWTDWLAKHASTALVRRMSKGLLSPATVQRAAGAMAPGKFRTVNNLGRGQFSLADRVVGNVGGHAGEMVRKLPTRRVADASRDYADVKRISDHYNQQFSPSQQFLRQHGATAGPPIAPYVAADSKGGFQQLATAHAEMPPLLRTQLTDVHPGNIGPNGQVLDYGLSQQAQLPAGIPRPRSISDQMGDKLISRFGEDPHNAGEDLLANLAVSMPSTHPTTLSRRQAAQAAIPESNNAIRRYWALPPEARAAYLAKQDAVPSHHMRQLQTTRAMEADALRRETRNWINAQDWAATQRMGEPAERFALVAPTGRWSTARPPVPAAASAAPTQRSSNVVLPARQPQPQRFDALRQRLRNNASLGIGATVGTAGAYGGATLLDSLAKRLGLVNQE